MANLEEIGRAEHYHLIRISPEYRNFLMLEEMQAEMQPPLVPREDDNYVYIDKNNKDLPNSNIGGRGYGGRGIVSDRGVFFKDVAKAGYRDYYKRKRWVYRQQGILGGLDEIDKHLANIEKRLGVFETKLNELYDKKKKKEYIIEI